MTALCDDVFNLISIVLFDVSLQNCQAKQLHKKRLFNIHKARDIYISTARENLDRLFSVLLKNAPHQVLPFALR